MTKKTLFAYGEKRGEIEPQDFSGNLIVQLGTITEELNRRWYQRCTGQTITDVQKRAQHPINKCRRSFGLNLTIERRGWKPHWSVHCALVSPI
jgi:hypothetical protein